MHRHWRAMRDKQDAVKLLEVVESAVCGHTGKDDISARLQGREVNRRVSQIVDFMVPRAAEEFVFLISFVLD